LKDVCGTVGYERGKPHLVGDFAGDAEVCRLK